MHTGWAEVTIARPGQHGGPRCGRAPDLPDRCACAAWRWAGGGTRIRSFCQGCAMPYAALACAAAIRQRARRERRPEPIYAPRRKLLRRVGGVLYSKFGGTVSVEVAVLGVGKSVVQLVVRRWLSGRAVRAADSNELVELIKTGFPDEIKRRKAERQFEAIADSVSERLLPFTRQEFGGLDDGDREAVLYQVVLTLDQADLSDEALLADDVN